MPSSEEDIGFEIYAGWTVPDDKFWPSPGFIELEVPSNNESEQRFIASCRALPETKLIRLTRIERTPDPVRWIADSVFALLLALITPYVLADDTLAVATYIEQQGRVIELAETPIDQLIGVKGALLALDVPELAERHNQGRDDDTVVRYWMPEGDEWVRVYFKERRESKRFHRDDVKTRIVDRPWISAPAAPFLPDPA